MTIKIMKMTCEVEISQYLNDLMDSLQNRLKGTIFGSFKQMRHLRVGKLIFV